MDSSNYREAAVDLVIGTTSDIWGMYAETIIHNTVATRTDWALHFRVGLPYLKICIIVGDCVNFYRDFLAECCNCIVKFGYCHNMTSVCRRL